MLMRILAICSFVTVCMAPAKAGAAGDLNAPYGKLLERHVDENGLVDYSGLLKDRSTLESYLESVQSVDRNAYDAWNRGDQVAFWINTYNAFVLAIVTRNYPIIPGKFANSQFPKNSVWQLGHIFDDMTLDVLGQSMSLNQMENMLRTTLAEPRCHMALVCAAMSCPPLRREPYVGAKVDAQLDEQVRRFIEKKENFNIVRDYGYVNLSKIFDWYRTDFVDVGEPQEFQHFLNQTDKNNILFILSYVDQTDRDYLLNEKYRVVYLSYDWHLNEQNAFDD